MTYETHTDTIDWTNHPDAHPERSNCPSCGEAVTDVDDERCPECERDLRLPAYAIRDDLCLCCKVPINEADDSVMYVRTETGERICSNCTADLRAFKYEVEVQTLVANWVTDAYRDDLNAALFQVSEAHEKDYSFTANANARYGRMEPLPDAGEEELTIDDVIDGEVTAEELADRAEVSADTEPDGETGRDAVNLEEQPDSEAETHEGEP